LASPVWLYEVSLSSRRRNAGSVTAGHPVIRWLCRST